MARRGSTTELAALLASLDLSAYLPAFVEDNLDDRSLVSLREGDLRALGIPATARRRFLEAVDERRHVPEALHQLIEAAGAEAGRRRGAGPGRQGARRPEGGRAVHDRRHAGVLAGRSRRPGAGVVRGRRRGAGARRARAQVDGLTPPPLFFLGVLWQDTPAPWLDI